MGVFWVLWAALGMELAWSGEQRVARVVHWEDRAYSQQRWGEHSGGDRESVNRLFLSLERSSLGRRLLAGARQKAQEQGKELGELIQPGPSSATHITLFRRFQRSWPQAIDYRIHALIHINRTLTTAEAVLDLAHELVHFVRRDHFNPYGAKLNVLQFMAHIIEGKGGEVDAYIAECRVLGELFKHLAPARARCARIRRGDGSYSRSRAIALFYRVGGYYAKISSLLGFLGYRRPHSVWRLSAKSPLFISSISNTPYPVAAIGQYLAMREKTCLNDRRRRAEGGREPAGGGSAENYFRRCFGPRLQALSHAWRQGQLR